MAVSGGMGAVSVSRHPSRTAMPIVLLGGAGALLALVLGFRWGGEGTVRIVDNVILLGLSVFATVCAVLAARRAHGRGSRAWATLAGALGAWTTAGLIWVFDAFAWHRNSFQSLSDLCYFVFIVLVAVAMALFPTGPARESRLRLILDGATVALCLFLLLWLLVLHKAYDAYGEKNGVSLVALLFPLGDLVVLTTAVLVLERAEARHRRVLWLLTAAIALVTITHSAYIALAVSGRFHTGSLVDLGWAASLITFAAAALYSRRYSPPSRPAVPDSSNSSLWLPYLPLLLAGTIGPVLIMSGVERVVVPLVVVAVCLRQAAGAWENRRLLTAAADHALRDPLTGLANRTLFHDRLVHAMMLRQRDDRSVAVVSLDLDDFKLVNDILGHPAADTVLIHVGSRIIACVRPGDTVARLDGDEFALLLEGRADHSRLVAERVVEAFAEPFVIDGEKMLVRPSVGMAVALPDEPDVTPVVLMERADVAMHAAKRSRSWDLHTFSSGMALVDPDVLERAGTVTGRPAGDGAAQIRLLGELRQAVDNGALDLVYQPKVDLRSGRIVGVEALLRWPHPQLGVLRPDEFMWLVRQYGLMRPVTDLVIDKALDDAASWVAQGVGTPVAVNVFAPFLREAQLPDALHRALQKRGLPAEMLTIEITEDLVLNDVSQVMEVLHRLREHGIRVAIDDFGSGYSALSYLRDLPIDEVKLDRQFIASVTEDARAAAVVRAVIDLTRDLLVTVVAEGVEDAETAAWLRDHGCDIGQGYYFGMPADAATIPELIRVGAARGG
jgi:diguanylate cyclase (GGDEF)-like protein